MSSTSSDETGAVQQQPVAWNMQRPRPPAPLQQEQGECLRTAVFVTGILHIVLGVFTFNVLGCIGGGFKIVRVTQTFIRL